MAITLSGRLQDPFGNALENAGVRFRSARTSSQVLANYIAETTTDSNGDYTISVQFGSFHIEARQSTSEPWYTVARNIPITAETTSTDINSLIVAYLGAEDATPEIVVEIEAITAAATSAASEASASASRAEAAASNRVVSADSIATLESIASSGGVSSGQGASVKGTSLLYDGATFTPEGSVKTATYGGIASALSVSDGADISESATLSEQNVGLAYVANTSRSTIYVNGNDSIGVNLTRNDSRLGQRSLSGIRIDGQDNQNLSGTNRTGIFDLGSLNAKLDTVFVRNCQYGMIAERTMELGVFDALFQRNEVGYLIRPSKTAGGGNANSHYSTRYQTNMIGLMLYVPSDTNYDMATNLFYGGLLQENERHAVVLINDGPYTHGNTVLDGFHVEGNNNDAESYVYDGQTIPASVIYTRNASLVISNTRFAESTGNMPCVLAEGGAIVQMHNISGYGSTQGIFLYADDESKIYESGTCNLIGRRYGLYSYGHPRSLASKAFVVGRNVRLNIDRSVPNYYSGANLNPMIPQGNGSPTSTEVEDNGRTVRQLEFAASVGSSSTNRWAIGTSASNDGNNYKYVSLLVKSDRDAEFMAGLRGAANDNPQPVSLKADVWYRLVSMVEANDTTSTNFFIWPADTSGAVVKVTGFMARATNDFSELAYLYSDNAIDIMSGSL